MHTQKNDREQGQAILIMVFAIIALAAMVGLAIDGGNLYALRRRAQIAADSTAMAGTQMLADLISQCSTPTVGQDTAIRNKILEYARLNGVDEFAAKGDVTAWYINKDGTELGFVGAGTAVPVGASGIRARVVVTEATSFMRLFGIQHVAAPGEATAKAGQVMQVGGGALLPIAVWDEVVMNLPPGQSFTMLKTGEFKDFCKDHPEACAGLVESSAQRGWLQLGHIFNKDKSIMARAFTKSTETSGDCSKGLDQAGLRRWLLQECPYPHAVYAGQKNMDNGDFILGVTGSKTPGLQDIEANWLGKIVFAPVFDLVYSGTDQKIDPRMNTIFPGTGNIPQPINTWVDGASTYYYHIIGFTAVKLTARNGDELVGEFQYASIKAGQINPGAGLGSGTCVRSLVGYNLSK